MPLQARRLVYDKLPAGCTGWECMAERESAEQRELYAAAAVLALRRSGPAEKGGEEDGELGVRYQFRVAQGERRQGLGLAARGICASPERREMSASAVPHCKMCRAAWAEHICTAHMAPAPRKLPGSSPLLRSVVLRARSNDRDSAGDQGMWRSLI